MHTYMTVCYCYMYFQNTGVITRLLYQERSIWQVSGWHSSSHANSSKNGGEYNVLYENKVWRKNFSDKKIVTNFHCHDNWQKKTSTIEIIHAFTKIVFTINSSSESNKVWIHKLNDMPAKASFTLFCNAYMSRFAINDQFYNSSNSSAPSSRNMLHFPESDIYFFNELHMAGYHVYCEAMDWCANNYKDTNSVKCHTRMHT